MADPEVRHRHEIVIRAPAEVVMGAARNLDLLALPLVRLVFRTREWVLRAKSAPMPRRGLVAETLGIGWGVISNEPGRWFIAGAACQPWMPNVVFVPIPPERFATFAEPGRVKILWSLEAEAIDPVTTRFATETRIVATDREARVRFKRYWRTFGIGIVAIRWLLLPNLRREAERRWHEMAVTS